MKKGVLILLLFNLLIGITFGLVHYIDYLNLLILLVFWAYPIYLLGLSYYVNNKYELKGLYPYLYPITVWMMYIPINFLAGLYLSDGEYRYYTSYPRYNIIMMYLGYFVILYLFASLLTFIIKPKHEGIVYKITNYISVIVIPLLYIVTYFVSPH